MLLCKAALSASWLRAIKFSFYSCRVTFGTSTTAFPSQESWTQATLMSVRRLEKRCVKFNLTSYGRSNHAKMCIFIIWPTDRKGWAYQRLLTSQPATNTRRNCVCVWFFILSLFHVQTQSSFTQREKKKIRICLSTRLGNVWDPYFLASHIPSVVPPERALDMRWCYTSVPLVQAPLRN